jgi:hypothetical protein
MRKATTERPVQTSTALDRIGALSGAAYFVLANVAIAIGADRQLPDVPTGQETLDGMSRLASNPLAQAATSLEILAFVAWMVFVGHVAWRVRAAGWLAAVVLVGGIVEIAVKVGSAAPLVTTYALHDQMTPEMALALTQENLTAFKIGLLPAGVFVLSAAIAALRTHELGRVLAWAGIAIGTANLLVVIVTGVNVGREGFAPSFLFVLLWEVVVSVVWGFARRRRTVVDVAEANDAVAP